ncbi:MAG: hypothetical protein WCZ89_06805 [Phycisphaerae bacterium]
MKEDDTRLDDYSQLTNAQKALGLTLMLVREESAGPLLKKYLRNSTNKPKSRSPSKACGPRCGP